MSESWSGGRFMADDDKPFQLIPGPWANAEVQLMFGQALEDAGREINEPSLILQGRQNQAAARVSIRRDGKPTEVSAQ